MQVVLKYGRLSSLKIWKAGAAIALLPAASTTADPPGKLPRTQVGHTFSLDTHSPITMSAQPIDSKVTKDDQTTLDTVEPVHGIKSPTSAAHGGRAHVDGEHVKLERNFSAFAALAIAFSILNSWCACCLCSVVQGRRACGLTLS